MINELFEISHERVINDILCLKNQLISGKIPKVQLGTNIPIVFEESNRSITGILEKKDYHFLLGIRNDNLFSIDVTLTYGKTHDKLSHVTIKSGCIGYLFNGYPLQLTALNTNIYYAIRKTKCDNIVYSLLWGIETIYTSFIYGYVTTEARTILMNKCSYITYRSCLIYSNYYFF